MQKLAVCAFVLCAAGAAPAIAEAGLEYVPEDPPCGKYVVTHEIVDCLVEAWEKRIAR
jgi:hypothetical protein